MKNSFLIIFVTLYSLDSYARCSATNPDDILMLIKKNHPSISLNSANNKALQKSIKVAEQRPNPELDIGSNVGDTLEGNSYTTSVSLKHTFELGGKRNSRIKVAEAAYNTGAAFSIFRNEDVIIDSVLKLHRLRQLYELIPLYEESLSAFNKILSTTKGRKSLSPEKQVEAETLELVSNDYKLKISQLNSERINLSKQLKFFMGVDCEISKKILPTIVNLSENFDEDVRIDRYSKYKVATSALDFAKKNYQLEKANSYPDIQIGPSYEYQTLDSNQTNTVGISLTMDLPILNNNRGGRARASQEMVAAVLNLQNVKNESTLNNQFWISKYNQYKKSLKTIANKANLEKKHRKIESLFKRGIISTSLVIESHRQLIEFSNTRFEFENGATEALWNIYRFKGEIENKKL